MLKNLIGLERKDVISVVGSGGKTSFLYALAKELQKSKVLVTTTTKMLRPSEEEVDYLELAKRNRDEGCKEGITFLYDYINEENKVQCSERIIDLEVNKFDFSIIESDGSKRKPIKAWNENEPVVIDKTTKTVGIIPIQVMGMKISDENIHRFELFQKQFNKNGEEYITFKHIREIIFSDEGLFKNSKGEKILFINGIDGEKELDVARKLLENIVGENNRFPLKIIGGTLKGLNFFKF